MRQMGVDTPVFGLLADYFAVTEGGECRLAELIHPKVEPEIAFVLKRPLRGPGCHVGAVLAATDFVMPAIEIIDSRYRDFRFDLKSVVADNCSSSRFVVGARITSVEGLDLRATGEVTGAISGALDAPPESVRVLIQEMPKAHFGIGGRSAEKLGR